VTIELIFEKFQKIHVRTELGGRSPPKSARLWKRTSKVSSALEENEQASKRAREREREMERKEERRRERKRKGGGAGGRGGGERERRKKPF